MPLDLISTAVGVLLGIVGTVVASKLIDLERSRAAARRAKKEFLATKDEMSELIAEMKADVSRQDARCIRELVILPTKPTPTEPPGPPGCFVYFEHEHRQLEGKMHTLEGRGYLREIEFPGARFPTYRMTEEFVDLLRAHG